MEKYQLIKIIGDGSFGTVGKYKNITTKEIVAIKKLKIKFTTWDSCINLCEVKHLANISHPNIIKLIEVIKEKNELYLVFEYLSNTLLDIIKDNNVLNEIEIRNILFQIFEGLYYLHKKGYFHRDLKPENILEMEKIVKIADFGLCKQINNALNTTYISTRWYRAPELILSAQNYNEKIDIFAIGCIMAELYLKKPFFPGKNENDQLIKIIQILGREEFFNWKEGQKLCKNINFDTSIFNNDIFNGNKIDNIFINNTNQNFINLLKNILKINPKERPNCEEILQHEYFQVRIIKEEYYIDNNSIIENYNKNMLNLETVNNSKLENSIIYNEDNNDEINFEEYKKILENSKYKPGVNLYEIYIKEQNNLKY